MNASATLVVEGREYRLYAGQNFLNVATGNAIRLRSPGKAFQSVEEVQAHYKKDGVHLAKTFQELKALIKLKQKVTQLRG